MSQINDLLPKLMEEIGPIAKEGFNDQQKYSFRGVEQVLGRLQPILVRNNCSLSCIVTDHVTSHFEGKDKFDKPRTTFHASLTLSVTITAPDGSKATNAAAGEGVDFGGDKATSKAMSTAFKYAMFFGLCIPVDSKSIDDGDRSKKADPQRKKFAEIQKTIRNESDLAKAAKFKPRILQLIAEGEVNQTQGELLIEQLNLKLENVQA